MTTITYWRTDSSFFLHTNGHAGYADAGKDIVCAGISVLVQTLAKRVQEITEEYDYKLATGSAYVQGKGEKAVDAFDTVFAGLEMIREQFPSFLQIERIGVTYDEED